MASRSLAASFALAGGSGVGLAHLISGDGDSEVGVVRKVASVASVAVGSTGMAFLSAKTVLARAWVLDALYARPYDSATVLRQAGGRIGARAAVYCVAMMNVAECGVANLFPGFGGSPFSGLEWDGLPVSQPSHLLS